MFNDQIDGFILISKAEGILFFNHCFSGNTLQIPATPEQMRHFHLHERYDLKGISADQFHHRKKDEMAA